jgi:hypothetical protein
MTVLRPYFRSAFGWLALAAVALWPAPAAATLPDPVEAAERAYKDVDFETQLAQATRALKEGHHDPATLANIYRLLGIAHAALDSPDAAKQDFMKLLAIDRDVALEHVLSPRLRTPYMEARGFWDVSRARLELGLGFDPHSGDLEITLTDPLQMGSRVRVVAGANEPLAVAEQDTATRFVIAADALAGHAGRPLLVELLDPYENVILARVLTPPPPSVATRRTPNPPPSMSLTPRASSTLPTLPLVLAGSSLLALGVGVTAHVVRENDAAEWNGSGCEQVGRGSRADQCGNVDDRRRSAQNIAFIGYTASGALLAASVLSYLLASNLEPALRPGDSLACGVNFEGFGLSCNAAF